MSETTFMEVSAKIMAASANNSDATVEVGNLIEGYVGSSTFQVEEGEFVLSPQGFRQLGEHIGFPYQAIARLDDDIGLQKTVLRHVVADNQDKLVSLRVTGNKITHILGGDHVLLKNAQVIWDVNSLMLEGLLPPSDEIKIGPFYVGRDGRSFSLRIMCPTIWNYDVSANGRADPVYGALFISNDEKGEGSFRCGASIARVSCFNWTIGKFQMEVRHRFATPDEFKGSLVSATKLIGGYAEGMVNEMKESRSHVLERPELVFEKTAERLGIPAWAMNTGREYFDHETDASSVFDVVQAVTRASQVISDPGGKRKPRWGLRESVEQNVLELAREVIEGGEEAYVTTVGDVIGELSQYDPDSEAIGFSPTFREARGREVVSNQ